MKLTDKNILLISPESWEHIFVSKHHYAIYLGRMRNNVFFLNPPSGRSVVKATGQGNVWSVEYVGFPKGLRIFPNFIKRVVIAMVFRNLQKMCGVRFDVIWSFDNSVFFDFSGVPERTLKISHIVDLNQDFQTACAARTADICFCTTTFIQERLLQYNNRVFKINHGFNYLGPLSAEQLPGKNSTKAVYSGNLAMSYLDWILIHRLVHQNPLTDFIFIGPGETIFSEEINETHRYKKDIIHLPNVHFKGRVTAERLGGFLVAADILLVSYMEAKQKDQANPHKMMEYLGCGKMIVSTYTEEYKELNGKLILMSKKNSELPDLFREVIGNLDYWNSEQNRLARINVAHENTYEKQIERIEFLLNECGL